MGRMEKEAFGVQRYKRSNISETGQDKTTVAIEDQ